MKIPRINVFHRTYVVQKIILTRKLADFFVGFIAVPAPNHKGVSFDQNLSIFPQRCANWLLGVASHGCEMNRLA
jgi:hypothetical protein